MHEQAKSPSRLVPGAGATPSGATDERSAARAVQQMFDEIAPRYDLLNHTLSMNVDRLWWRRAKQGSQAGIYALDFSHQMLRNGLPKYAARRIQPIEADALSLPLPDSSMDLVVSAFGFRNLANYNAGLHEIFRVLKQDGETGILDFSEPGGLLGKMYGFYFRNVLPRIGAAISGVRGAYEYLPASVQKFPSPQQMLERMETVGFKDVSWTPYTFGIAGLYRGRK